MAGGALGALDAGRVTPGREAGQAAGSFRGCSGCAMQEKGRGLGVGDQRTPGPSLGGKGQRTLSQGGWDQPLATLSGAWPPRERVGLCGPMLGLGANCWF